MVLLQSVLMDHINMLLSQISQDQLRELTVTDTFTYTLSDGTATTANITITVIGGAVPNNSPSAVNDTDAVNEDATITKTGAQDDVLNDIVIRWRYTC